MGGEKIGEHNAAFVGEEDLKKAPPTRPPEVPPPARPSESPKDKLLRSLRSIPFLYLNPMYVLTSVSLATFLFNFIPILTVIIDYARDKDVQQEEEKFLIYAMSLGDLIGRLGFGWVTDRKFMSLPCFMFLSFVFQGAFTAIIPLSTTLTLWIVTLSLYGVAEGTIFAYMPVLVHKYVEQENQSIAMGCIGLIYSIACYGILPLTGYFRDNMGSYDGLFYTLSGGSILNGILWLIVTLSEKLRK